MPEMTPVFDSPSGFTTTATQDETVVEQPHALLGLPSGPVDDTIKSVLHGLLIGQTDPATAKTALSAHILALLSGAEDVAVQHLPAVVRMIVSSVLGGLQQQQQHVAETIAARIVDALS